MSNNTSIINISNIDNSINQHQELLEQVLIPYIDAWSLEEHLALHLLQTSTSREHLEELLIACTDSGTVDVQVATDVLGSLDQLLD